MDDREKNELASQLLVLLYDSSKTDAPAVFENTETAVNTIVEKTEISETEYVVRRRDMAEVSDFFCRDSRRYDNGFEVY